MHDHLENWAGPRGWHWSVYNSPGSGKSGNPFSVLSVPAGKSFLRIMPPPKKVWDWNIRRLWLLLTCTESPHKLPGGADSTLPYVSRFASLNSIPLPSSSSMSWSLEREIPKIQRHSIAVEPWISAPYFFYIFFEMTYFFLPRHFGSFPRPVRPLRGGGGLVLLVGRPGLLQARPCDLGRPSAPLHPPPAAAQRDGDSALGTRLHLCDPGHPRPMVNCIS